MSQVRRFLLAFGCCLPIFCWAQLPLHRGFYLGLVGGYSTAAYDKVTYLNGIQFAQIDENGLSPGVQIGYEFNRWAALELSALYEHRIFFKYPNINPNAPEAKTKNNVIYLAFRPRWFFHGDWYLFPKLGIGYVVNSNVSAANIEAMPGDEYVRPVYGAGLGYRPGVHWQLEIAWVQTPSNYSVQLPSTNFVGLGIQYLF